MARKKMALIAILLSIVMVNNYVVSAKDCYKIWYVDSPCTSCDDSKYNSEQTDSCSGKHKRQNGIKLCSSCKEGMSSCATYYKRGFSDYNCLAYALGKNEPQSWTWPASWGDGPTLKTFKKYISNKGYKYTTTPNEATGKEIIYVYVKEGKVAHFARKYTLDGKKVDGAKTISKWGSCSLYTTSIRNNPYTSDAPYGKMKLICYKE